MKPDKINQILIDDAFCKNVEILTSVVFKSPQTFCQMHWNECYILRAWFSLVIKAQTLLQKSLLLFIKKYLTSLVK